MPAIPEEKIPSPALAETGQEQGPMTFNIRELLDLCFSDDDGRDTGSVCRNVLDSDYDSDSDSKYVIKPEGGFRYMTDAEKADYYRQIEDSEGFDIERLENVIYAGLKPVKPVMLETLPVYARVAKEALEFHKQKTGESLELIKIVKANEMVYSYFGCDFYFTLVLKDEVGLKKMYRAKVKSHTPRGKIEMLFIKEHSGQSSSSLTSDSRASQEKNVICNDNLGASEGNRREVKATGKRSFAAMAESQD